MILPLPGLLSLKDYFENETLRAQFDELEKSSSNSTLDMTIDLEGDSTVVFTAKLKEQLTVNDTVKNQLKTQTDA